MNSPVPATPEQGTTVGPATAPPACASAGRWRFWLVVLAAAGLVGLVNAPVLQRRLGLSDHGAWFMDSYAILASSDAVRQGIDPALPNPLDVYHRSHSYSYWWFGLGRLGLTRDDNFLFGGVVVGLFFAAAMLNLAPRGRQEMFWYLALLLSPPVLLAVNRANNDLAIFALLGAGLWLARRGGVAGPAWFGGAVALATGLKFFPVVAAGAALVLRPVRAALAWTAGLSLVALLVLASVRTSLAHAVFPVPIGTHVFGAVVFWCNLGVVSRVPVVVSLGVLAVVAVLLAVRGWSAGLGDGRTGPQGEQMAFLTGTLLLLACFCAGISYAYRWVFALWLAPWLWRQAWGDGLPEARLPARLAVVLLTVSVWADGLYCLVVNTLIGPMPVERLRNWEHHWNVMAQPAVWGLMLLLAGWLAAALRAAWRDWRAT